MMDAKRLIVVLGMHRSGTSLLTKGLEALGVALGREFHPIRPDNPKGDWEDKGFHGLNEEMLTKLGHPWDDPGLINAGFVAGFCRDDLFPRAVVLLHERLREKTLFGIKDPRFALLLPFWKKVFDEVGVSVSYVIALRNPLSVAESLVRRNGFPMAKGLGLWKLYNSSIISGTAEASRVVLEYDALMDDPSRTMTRLAQRLNLSVNPAALDIFCSDFLDCTLRHARFADADLARAAVCDFQTTELYSALRSEAWGVAGEIVSKGADA